MGQGYHDSSPINRRILKRADQNSVPYSIWTRPDNVCVWVCVYGQKQPSPVPRAQVASDLPPYLFEYFVLPFQRKECDNWK